MKTPARSFIQILCIAVLMAVALAVPPARAASHASRVHTMSVVVLQTEPASAPEGTESKKEAAEEHETDAYRHSPMVQSISNVLHLPVETTARIFEIINFLILATAILWFLFKAVPKAFKARTTAIQTQLIEARTATENANQRLSAVEARLAKLDGEIAGIEAQAQKDSIQDEQRIKAAMEAEKTRILEAAEQEIASAGTNARRELKLFAAELALDQASKRIVVSADADRELVKNFADGFGPGTGIDGRRN